MSTNMRVWQLTAADGAYRLEQTTRPIPEPAAGRVVVRVRATSLNYRDQINLKKLVGREVAGRIPLSDGAGEVVAVGAGVTRVKVGDRVAGCFFQSWICGRFEMRHHQQDLGGTIDGMLCEYADLSADGVVAIPAHLSYEEAACLPCAGLTAWYALMNRGGLRSADSVLVLGTGGVSIFALQFAVAMGCPVYVISKSDAKLERCRSLGAVHTVNYLTNPDWDREIWKLSGQKGIDQIIEVGGPGTLGKSLGCVAPGGHIALIGVLTGFGPPQSSLFSLVGRNANLSGIYVGSRTDFEAMNHFLEIRQMRPIIDQSFGFDEAPAAYEYLASGDHLGKVVIRV